LSYESSPSSNQSLSLSNFSGAGTAIGILTAHRAGALKALIPITVAADEVIAAEVSHTTLIIPDQQTT